jgi:MtaA/CmuA family methyltransferase
LNGRERFRALMEGRPADSLPAMPITMMFAVDQIGRKYLDYALDYRVLTEAQIRTAEAFDFDHVSCIAETREAPDCGAPVEYFEDQPPSVIESQALLGDKARLVGLQVPDPEAGPRMTDRLRGIGLLKDRVGSDKIVEGWVEGPCGAAADLRGIGRLMLDFYDDPAFVLDLFAYVLEVGLRFARAQVQAGAELVGIGDPTASLVGPRLYREFVWPFEKRLVEGIHAAGGGARLHICGNTRSILAEMGSLGCDVVDLDTLVPLAEAREKMGPGQVLLGNLDPVRDLREGTPDSIRAALGECRRQAGPKYIVAAGCEVPRGTPAANIQAMVQFARGQ